MFEGVASFSGRGGILDLTLLSSGGGRYAWLHSGGRLMRIAVLFLHPHCCRCEGLIKTLTKEGHLGLNKKLTKQLESSRPQCPPPVHERTMPNCLFSASHHKYSFHWRCSFHPIGLLAWPQTGRHINHYINIIERNGNNHAIAFAMKSNTIRSSSFVNKTRLSSVPMFTTDNRF